jgi:hypothetical protein
MSGEGLRDVQPTAQDPAVTAELRKTLAVVPSLNIQWTAMLAAQPSEGSLLALELRHELGRYVWEQAMASSGSAIDHLTTLQMLIDRGFQPTMAHVTLARVVLECSCLACWLIDPVASSAERIRRGLLAQLADYYERGKFAPSQSCRHCSAVRVCLSAAGTTQKLVCRRLSVPAPFAADPFTGATSAGVVATPAEASGVVGAGSSNWALNQAAISAVVRS